MNYNWNWGIFFELAPDGAHTYLGTMMFGLGWTLATALSAWVIALALGSIVGMLRTTPNVWLARLGNAYVELFRNVPLLVQMFLWYFVLPEFVPPGARQLAQADCPTRRSTPAVLLPRPLHLGARRRAGARRHPVLRAASAWRASRWA